MVRYAILGPVELYDGKRRVEFAGPRQVALLALLLINGNRALSNDRLIDALWRDRGPAGGVKRLQMAVTRLRRTLDPVGARGQSVLRTVAGGYLLAVGQGELDAEVFQTRMEDGRRALEAGDVVRAKGLLGGALGMWRGPALAQVVFEEFAQPEIRRLEELRLAACEASVDCELRLGEHSAVIGELEALVSAHPGRERLAAQLMLALYRGGRQGEALEVYARTRAYLSGELGVEPGPALQRLQGEILAQSPALQPAPDEAGSASAAGAAAAEHARVLATGVLTFVLTDVEGSTGLRETDADAMAVALEDLEGLIGRLVEQHGGRLLKDKGEDDATLSVFQRASDAAACAAELQYAVVTASWPSGLELRLRVALHSGEVQERDGDYFGPVLNRAAQLRSLAAGGVTVLSQSTAALVRDRLPRELELVDVGRHELRGLSRPERVFELRQSTDAARAEAGISASPVMLALPRSLHAAASSPFVGRDTELWHLRERWMHVCGGTRSAVVIGGEAGIGKTRLASELAHAVHREGGLVLYGRCDDGLAVPYQPFVEALRPYARAVGLNCLCAELGDLAPNLRRLLPELGGLGEPARGDPESERFALFDAVAALIEAITREQPALLILDDLHWATPPTLALLRHLIRWERPLGVLVLCTYRDTEVDLDQPLAQLLADLQRDASAKQLHIGGLDEAAIAAMLQATVGHPLDERASELVRVLGVQTAGNPFFLRELLTRVAEPDESSSGHVTATQIEAPESLRQVIGQRVARLSTTARRALRVAAVAGPMFSFALLEQVLSEQSGVLDGLDEAVAAGLLADAGPGQYVFAHALVRQTIYEQLGSTRRMRLHRRLGEGLETLGDTEGNVEALAHHFAHAAADGQGVKASTYALAAGRSATARLGHEEAAAHYKRGLEALTLSGERQEKRRCELLLALGQAHWSAGEIDNARQACRQAAELAEQLGDATALAHAALGFCGPHRFEVAVAVTRPVVDLLQRALAALGEDDSALRAQLMGRLADALIYSDAQHRVPVLARQAREMAHRVGDKATLADVLASTLWVIRGPDVLHESFAMAKELAQVAAEVGDGILRALAHGWLLDFLLELGDIDAVERELEALQRLAETRKERYFTWLLAVLRANHALLKGRLEDCETLTHDALAHSFEGHDEAANRIFFVQTIVLRSEQGALDELMEKVESFAKQYPEIVNWRCARALIYAQLEHSAQARQELDALARTDFTDLRRDASWLTSVSSLAEVAAFLGDIPRAQLLYDLLLPYADRCLVTFALHCQGSASRQLGSLATTLSQYEDAQRHFEEALAMNAQIRSPLWIAHTQHDYARMLLLRNHRADRDKAHELLTQALASAEQLGLKALAAKTRPLKLTAEAAVAASPQPKPV
jgi:DNA-binding SARP family transcriptional activator/tetratricopeptide (TPR) repeat protein